MAAGLDDVRASSDTMDGLGLDSRGSLDADQRQRLLLDGPKDDEAEEDVEAGSEEWHLRTGWALLGSVLTLSLVFSLMILFIRYFVVEEVETQFDMVTAVNRDFRRPASDYILDPNWNFEASRTVRNYKWTILDRVANPDGVYRPMIMIDGQFPGPLIECNEGDTLVIDIDNQSVNATSIHFHGIFQNGTNWMDGSNGVTQCPIAPGGRFQYKFTVNGQSGTYFYHGHQAVQIADGLFGPLVIHSREERRLQSMRYATDRVVMLQDYYHDLSSGLLRSRLEPGSESDPIPDGALINGLNTRDCSWSSGRLCSNTTSSLPAFDLATDVNHRLRFINVGAFAWFEVSLDQHILAVSEVDGTNVEPFNTTQIHISPGQRYSAIITANQNSEILFWLRARMITNCFSDPELPAYGADEVRAIVRYSRGNKASSPNGLISQPSSRNDNTEFAVRCRDMDRKSFVPVPPVSAPVAADHAYYIRTNMEIGDWRLQRGVFNKSSFRPDLRSPSLHRVIDGLDSKNESFATLADGINDVSFNLKNEFVIQHQGVKVVDLIIQNMDEGSHPLHLHGHKFWVLGQGHAYFPGYEKADLDLVNPLRRDTAAVEGFGWMLLRFVTDNPGMWAFHCHMAWHSEAGLAMQFLSQPEVLATWKIPEANRRLCEAEGLEKGASPKDEIWFGFGNG